VRTVRNERGSVFLLCRLAARDARLSKYPSQPRLSCLGYEPPPDERPADPGSAPEGRG
jgi:hypothetical protein